MNLNNPWIAGTISAIIGGTIVGIILYFMFEYKHRKSEKIKKKNSIEKIMKEADNFLETDDPLKALELYEELGKSTDVTKIEYAYIQRRKGDSYIKIAEKNNKEENLKKAIKAYEEALKIYSVEKYPDYYRSISKKLQNLRKELKG